MSRYQVILKTPSGLEVKRLTKFNMLSCGRADKAIQPCEIRIPMTLPASFFTKDMIMEVWRDNGDGSISLDGETAYFLRNWEFYRDSNGKDYIYLYGLDSNYILDGREVEYTAESTQAKKSGVACDVIKEIIDENFVSATDTDRNISSSYFTIDSDDGFGASVTKAFSRQYVLSTIQSLVDQSRNAGTWITFDVEYDGSYPFTFKTYLDQRGDDLTDTVIVSVEANTLTQPKLRWSYANEKTAAYMAGIGDKESRLVGSATSTNIDDSIWSRREVVSENFQVVSETLLDNEARALLEKNKGKLTLTGKIGSTKGLQYGRDWNYGDKIRATYLDNTFDCRISAYSILYGNDGSNNVDTVTAYIYGEDE